MNEDRKETKEWISIRVKPEEYSKIYALFQETTCRKLSEYVRRVLLKKPVVVNYRNQTAEESLDIMNRLKNELNAIGNNYNQAVKKLHSLKAVPELKIWIILNEATRQNLVQKIEEVRLLMNKIYELWSQK
jgi:hypothetical protein